MNLAIQVELPVIICDVQRVGPSTGLPTKDRAVDLLQVMFAGTADRRSRHRRRPRPRTASTSRSKLPHRLKFMVPVVLLSDGYIANGSEPWKLPEVSTCRISPAFRTDPEVSSPTARTGDLARVGHPRHAGPGAPESAAWRKRT